MAPHHDSAELLRSSGRRVTQARLTVMSILRTSGSHMTPSEVIGRVEGTDVHVNQSTIYRTLSDLRDAGLVSESRFGSGEASYEWILDQNHHHVHCTGCGETVELDEKPVRRFLSDVARESGFVPDTKHLVITGLCRRCQAN